MDRVRDATEVDEKKYSLDADAFAVASKYMDSFISFKNRSIARYEEALQTTPYDNIKFTLKYLIEKETESIKYADTLKKLLSADTLHDVGLRKNKDLQIYDHFEKPEVENIDSGSLRDILMAAIVEDKDMIDRLKIIGIENENTETGKAVAHLINTIINAKNAITDVLLGLDTKEW